MREWLTALGLVVAIWVCAGLIRPTGVREHDVGTGSLPTISGGELVSLNQPTIASSMESSSLSAANATDSSSSTRWGSQFSNNQWIYVDLGQVRPLLGVVLFWEAAYGRSYKVQVSNDAANWADVFSTSTGDGGYDVIDGLNASGRYVRVLGVQRATQYGYSLFRFDVYARQDPNTPVLLSRYRPAVASSVEGSSYVATNVTDDSSSSRWSSQFADNNWIYLDLGARKHLTSIVLHWQNSYAVQYQVQTSDNARDWTSIYSTTTGDGGTDTIPVDSHGRYVRMLGVKRKTQYGYSLFDFAVYGQHLNVPRTTLAVNAGASVSYTSGLGVVYSADKYFTGGSTCSFDANSDIAGTTEDFLFRTERNGNFSYKLPLPSGKYNVTLSFSENHWNEAGRRVFDVQGEGATLIAGLDIFSVVGKNRAFEKTFLVSVADGYLDLKFVSRKDNAKISAIHVAATAPSTCQNSNLALTDVRADFRDIWLGREDAETGKRTEAFPAIELTFNEPVDAKQLSARLVGLVPGDTDAPVDCIDTYDRPVEPTTYHNVHLFGQTDDGSSTGTTLRMMSGAHLRAGCQYQLVIDRFPATQSGSCMPETYSLTFKVADKAKTAFDREMASRRYQRFQRAPTSFTAAPGINSTVDAALQRYGSALGLREGVDSLVAITAGAPSPMTPGQSVTLYRQHYRGVPIDGYGYLIQHEAGTFRSASGNLLSHVDPSVTPTIAATSAVSNALQYVHPAKRPWETNPQVPAPSAQLLLQRQPQAPSALKLIWRVRFSGIPEATHVDVDAQNGSVLGQERNTRYIAACPGYDPKAPAVFSGETTQPVSVPYSAALSSPQNVTLGRWTQGGASYTMFRNNSPFDYQTLYTTGDDMASRVAVNVCSGDDAETAQVAAAHWGLQNAVGLFDNFEWGDGFWEGLTGTSGAGSLNLELLDVSRFDNFQTVGLWGNQNAPDNLWVRSLDLFPHVLGHEYAHGVLYYGRKSLGLAPLSHESEAGAIEEAYGDIMGALATLRSVPPADLDPWCVLEPVVVLPQSGRCQRHLVDPKSAVPPGPDTYLGHNWQPVEAKCDFQLNDYCYVHRNSSVMSHWFYVLAYGQDPALEGPNDKDCAVSVKPLSPDLGDSLQQAGQVVFSATAQLDTTATLLQMREKTRYVADTMYGPEAARSVEQAWLAVGVGEVAKPSVIVPGEGETDVEPWPAIVRWEVGDQPGPWKLRYSKDENFSDAAVVDIEDAREIDGKRYAYTRVSFDADTTYYWQGQEAGGLVNENWTDCGAFTSSFTTSAKPLYLTMPAEADPNGYYVANHDGRMEVGFVRGDYVWFEFRLSETDDQCNQAAAWERTGHNKFYLGDTIDVNIVNPPDALRLRPDLELDPDRTYHLYARAVTTDGHVGSCNHFPVRKIQLLPFELVAPLHYPVIAYDSGGPFVWTPALGAVRYELVVDGWECPDGTEHSCRPIEVLREAIDAKDVELNADGNIEYVAKDKKALNRGRKNTSEMSWEVFAFHENGEFRQGWDPGSPNFTTRAQFFAGADEISLAFNENGQQDPFVKGELTAYTLIFPPGSDHKAKFCLSGSTNMRSARYWFGTVAEASHIDESKLKTAEYEADSANSACTELLDFTSLDEKILVAWPYSWVINDGEPDAYPVGFGPPHAFHIRRSDCGGPREPCCPTLNQECSAGTTCIQVDLAPPNGGVLAYRCMPCGHGSEACCANDACESGANCENVGMYRVCLGCGEKDQKCCGGSSCNSNGLVCQGGHCKECGRVQGFPALPCCAGDVCNEGACNPVSHVCAPCGGANQLDCPTNTPGAVGKRCNTTVEVGENKPSSYEVDMGRSQGRATLFVNTVIAADNVIVSQDNTTIFETGCVGTLALNWTGCALDGLGRKWCCEDDGDCSTDFVFAGSSNHVDVDVDPNCSGTTDTLWAFLMSCPLPI